MQRADAAPGDAARVDIAIASSSFESVTARPVQVELHGERLLLMSGQVGMDHDGRVPPGTIAQLDLALDNVRRNLAAAGLDMNDLVKFTFYIVGDVDTDERRRVVASKLGDHRPCMTLLFISSLATPALKVEIDA